MRISQVRTQVVTQQVGTDFTERLTKLQEFVNSPGSPSSSVLVAILVWHACVRLPLNASERDSTNGMDTRSTIFEGEPVSLPYGWDGPLILGVGGADAIAGVDDTRLESDV